MNTNSPEHRPFVEMMPAYVMDGLDADERAALESHLAICAACRQTLADITAADRTLAGMFQDVTPDVGFEDRVIDSMREAGGGRRLMIHPSVWRIGSGIAAALVLAGVGYTTTGMLQGKHGSAASSSLQARHASSPGIGAGGNMSKSAAAFGAKFQHQWRDGDSNDDYIDKDPRSAKGKLTEWEESNGSVRYRNEHNNWSIQLTDGKEGQGQGQVDGFHETNGTVAARGIRGFKATEPEDVTGKLATLSYSDGEKGARAHAGYFADVSTLNGQPLPVLAGDAVASAGASVAGAPGVANRDMVATGGVAFTGITNGTDGGLGFASGGGGGGGGGGGNGRGRAGGLTGISAGTLGISSGNGEVKGIEGVVITDGTFFKPADLYAGIKGVHEGEKDVAQPAGTERTGKAFDVVAAADPAAPGKDDSKPNDNSPANTSGTANAPAPQPDKPGTQQQPPPAPPIVQQQQQQQQRKIIRNGEMEFEVESFDSTYLQISKIVQEEGGFVSSTDSEKLANGKVRGTVSVRVPPERLDTLVLKLRALGDLRGQRISAQDVTKKYHDIAAELRASKAMEERLLNIIKSGKGEIKDLIEAEKQYGVYREKSEKLEGEIRYFDNLVSLSTLTITAMEKDIKTPALAAQTENVKMSIVSDEVEKARAEALKAIDEAKGRVIASELKKHDAGQFSATITADVAPDASGPVIDRLRQLGQVSQFEIDRQQSTPAGRGAPAPNRVERKDTRLVISIFNLNNIQARQAAAVVLAVPNVEEAYRAVLETVRAKSGRVIVSNLNRQRAEQTTAQIEFEVPAAEGEATLSEIRRDRDVMSVNVVENRDTANTTASKRGFKVDLKSTAEVQARETEELAIPSRGPVAETFRKLAEAARKADARVIVSQVAAQEKPGQPGATLDVEVQRSKEAEFRAALAEAAGGVVLDRRVRRAADAAESIDSKVRLVISVWGFDQLKHRETQKLNLAAKDVPGAFQAVINAVNELGGRVVSSALKEQSTSPVRGEIVVDVPADKRDAMNKALDAAGVVFGRQVERSNDTQGTVDLKFRMNVSVGSGEQLPPRETTKLKVEVPSVEDKTNALRDAALKAGGRTIELTQSTDGSGRATSRVVVDVPLARADEVRARILAMGKVRDRSSSHDAQAPDGQHGRAHIDVTLLNEDQIVADDQGLGASFRNALSMSVRGLLLSLQFVVIGLLMVGPWALIVWKSYRLYRKHKAKPVVVTA